MISSMATARAVQCEAQQPRQAPRLRPELPSSSTDQVKIVLQPRLCTLRSYASDRGSGVIRTTIVPKSKDGSGGVGDGIGCVDEEELLSPFLANLFEYIESSKKSHDFEIITGRLAMVLSLLTLLFFKISFSL